MTNSDPQTRRQACAEAIAKACLDLGNQGFASADITAAVAQVMVVRLVVTAEGQLKTKFDAAAERTLVARGGSFMRILVRDFLAEARSVWARRQ